MRKLFGLLFLLCAVSCREPLLDSIPRFMREQDRFSRNAGEGSGEARDTSARPVDPLNPTLPEYVPSLYATALHFRDSVNWRRDSLGAAEVLFFKDGELQQRLPVSSPPDPERHRIWNGQLWTDATDGHQTVLYCDGEERIRFSGEEQLRGFLIVDGDVHTLGQRPGKGGFCYRINGEAVFSQDKGSVLGSPSAPGWKGGALRLDGGSVYWCYSLPVTLKDRVDREYHVMKGAETFRTVPAGTSQALYDLRVYNGHLWRAEKRAGTLFLLCDDQEFYFNVSTAEMVSCRLIPAKDRVQVLGCNRMGGSGFVYWVATPGPTSTATRGIGRSDRSELRYLDPDGLFADVDAEGRVQTLLYGTQVLDLAAGVYTCPSPLDLFLDEKHYAAALTHGSASTHLLLYDGKQTTVSFNGYFTSVIIE